MRRPHVPKLMHLAGLSPKDSGLVGWVAFCIFQVELRRWLTTKELDIDEGMAALQRAAERAPPKGRRA